MLIGANDKMMICAGGDRLIDIKGKMLIGAKKNTAGRCGGSADCRRGQDSDVRCVKEGLLIQTEYEMLIGAEEELLIGNDLLVLGTGEGVLI